MAKQKRPDYQIKGEAMLDMLQGTPPREAMTILGFLMTAVLGAYEAEDRGELMASWIAYVSQSMSTNT